MEEWRPVTEPDFEDAYLVSSEGRVAKILRGSVDQETGYAVVCLSKKGVAYRYYRLHQLIARAFNGPQPEGMVVNHRDCDKRNNRPDNLEYITQRGNVLHAIMMGARKILKHPHNGQFKPLLTVDQVGEIKSLLNCGTPVHLIAADYLVTSQAIMNIKKGRNWNRVPAKP